jgi:phage/plasmid-like protein (TIGR03299 family)
MAHNLNETNGIVSFAGTLEKGQKSWHGLGQYVDSAMTSEEAIKLARLDYKIEKWDIQAYSGIELAEDDQYKAVVRTDTKQVLGMVSPKYEIIQNEDCFKFFDEIIDKGEAIYETAGALGKGERIFLTAKLPNDIVVKGEEVDLYFMLTNGHNGKHGLVAGLTPIRVVCNNTLTAALGNIKNKVTVRHHKDANLRLREAYNVMGMASKYTAQISPIFNAMADRRMNDQEFRKLIMSALKPNTTIVKEEESTRLRNMTEDIFAFSQTHDTQQTEATKGTMWGAVNSVSGYLNWTKDYRSAEEKMKDISFGNGARQIEQVFQNAYKLL